MGQKIQTKDKKPWFTSSKANQNETTFSGSSGQYIESWVGFIYILVQILVYSHFDLVSLFLTQLPSRMVAQMATRII